MIKFYRLKYEGNNCYVQRRGLFSKWVDYKSWVDFNGNEEEFLQFLLSIHLLGFRCKTIGTPSLATLCSKTLKDNADKFADNMLKHNNLLNKGK